MDTAQPQAAKCTRCKNMGIFSTIVGTLIGFFAGIYIGIHPQWIPVRGIGPAEDTTETQTKPMFGPTTSPSTAPAVPATQGQ